MRSVGAGGCSGSTTSVLRETRMPAVQVEPFFATNEMEPARLSDPAFTDAIGRAIAAGRSALLRRLTLGVATAAQGPRG